MIKILWLSTATAAISFLVTQSSLFGGFRDWVGKRSKCLHELLTCYYCLGHWVAVALVIAFRARLFGLHPLAIDFILTILVVAWLAALQCVVMDALWKAT